MWEGRGEQQASGGNREPEQRAVLKIRLLAPHTEAGLQERERERERENKQRRAVLGTNQQIAGEAAVRADEVIQGPKHKKKKYSCFCVTINGACED